MTKAARAKVEERFAAGIKLRLWLCAASGRDRVGQGRVGWVRYG